MNEMKRCATCKWNTYRFNKDWCDLKSEPYPSVCDQWTQKEGAKCVNANITK